MKSFKIHQNELIPALLAAIFIVLLNTLNVLKYYDIFSVVTDGNYHDVFKAMHISGFDPYTYETVSRWDVLYEVTRHPLMAFYMFVPAKINEALIALTGTNYATVIVGALWALCAFYAFIFLFRILHELQGLGIKSSSLLCALFYSFGYTMLSIFVPDHFGPSVMLLLMTIYVIGLKSKGESLKSKGVGIRETMILFVLTAGVSLSNGIKVFLAVWINKGRKFFKLKYLAYAVILPSILLFGFAQLEQQVFVQPRIDAAKEARMQADKEWRAGIRKAYCDTAKYRACSPEHPLECNNLDSAKMEVAVKSIIKKEILKKFHEDHQKPWNKAKGKALSKTGFMSWTDISTPRWQSLVENVFGEPVQMHEDYFLEDVLQSRPVIVNYNHWYNYLAEAVLLLLMVIGIWVGRHQKVVWMVLSFFAFDMLIHLGLGFGLNEVYIMSPHYLFMIPIMIAPLLVSKQKLVKRGSIATTVLLTLWFFYWNLPLLVPFLIATI